MGDKRKKEVVTLDEAFKRDCGDQQPNDVEAVKPVINSGNHADKLYSQQTIDQLQEKIAELKKENKYISEINHSVSVCANHTDEITTQSDCMICTIIDTESKLKHAEEKIAEINNECDERTQEVFDLQKENGELLTALTDTEAKLKQAEKVLETLDNLGGLGYEKHGWIKNCLDTIRKETPNADKS